ncbi:MAG: hypothetical protein DRN06_02535 [Thermoprotei archaeon]|nr:MAG: hypothetical protein DRN06_02535 [Thermoprotei archaeon]
MILVVSTCRFPLSEEEFVRPIVELIEEKGGSYRVRRYYEEIRFERYSKVIVCGTALRDFDYLNYVENFRGLAEYGGEVLGICAGYQILAVIYGNRLEEVEKIGVRRVEVVESNPLTVEREFYAYFLHVYALREANERLEVLALQGDEIAMFRVSGKDFYGVSFHPEVLNRDIIERFILL